MSNTIDLSGDTESTDKWLTDRIVTITVGREERRWLVHEKLLSQHSAFFDEYFNGAEEEPIDRDEMKLPEEDPKLFALFIRWLYGTAFATSGGRRVFRFPVPNPEKVDTPTVRDYLGLYVLGGKLGVIGVRNAASDALYEYYGPASDNHKPPNLHDVKYIFDNTTPDAPLRRFLIAQALFYLFSLNRRNAPLPRDWIVVLTQHAEIGFAMIRMLADWNWAIGDNAPNMNLRPRQEFHERIPLPPIAKDEVDDDPVEFFDNLD
ncbi:hypothetical protein MMYC01_202143 [Madurella mycetomatis]|uniref:BTB domain-containing protein n=1 Tax=Madurella mycetomatis TaxID=100816 RepID=A0A175WAC5_9PEZI|nr:hypothetical protein MMYC01_202143 [Madurella mycetomatis]